MLKFQLQAVDLDHPIAPEAEGLSIRFTFTGVWEDYLIAQIQKAKAHNIPFKLRPMLGGHTPASWGVPLLQVTPTKYNQVVEIPVPWHRKLRETFREKISDVRDVVVKEGVHEVPEFTGGKILMDIPGVWSSSELHVPEELDRGSYVNRLVRNLFPES